MALTEEILEVLTAPRLRERCDDLDVPRAGKRYLVSLDATWAAGDADPGYEYEEEDLVDMG